MKLSAPFLCLPLLLLSCNNDVIGGQDTDMHGADASVYDRDGGTGGRDGGQVPDGLVVPDGGVLVPAPDGGVRVCLITPCAGHVYQCGDCIDNDHDGLVDSDDPDCLGACHNTESSLNTDIPGGNNAPCKQDCYFDQDTGSGNDQCYWDHRCDPHEVAADGYSPEGSQCAYNPREKINGTLTCDGLMMSQSTQCLNFCKPLTPNGCDCFGCCTIGPKKDSLTEGIWLGSTDASGRPCTLDTLDDPTRCHVCQIVPSCFNRCNTCQLCVGKTTVPPECITGGGKDGGVTNPGQCPGGQQACGLPGQPACPGGFYCVTGCCIPIIG